MRVCVRARARACVYVPMLSNDSCVLFVGVGCKCVCACMLCACVRTCLRACVRVPMFSNDSFIGLVYDAHVSWIILGNMITHAHIRHELSYYPRAMLIFPKRNVI